jgi:hypothetical protein
MNRRAVLPILVLLPLAGCKSAQTYFQEERSQVCLSPDEAREHWATIATIYKFVKPYIIAACASGKLNAPDGKTFILPPAICAKLREIDTQYQAIAFEARRWTDNPGVRPNWAHIGKALEVVGKIVSVIPV